MQQLRQIRAISPTMVGLWRSDRAEFYRKYITPNKPIRMAQTRPMSAGSAFDAYVKSHISHVIHGDYGRIIDLSVQLTQDGEYTSVKGHKYALDSLMLTQVEPINRDWAYTAGKSIFDAYMSSGTLGSLLRLLDGAVDIRMETRMDWVTDGVPMVGIPDLSFVLPAVRVIHDFKVNGFCGKTATSPKPGYLICRDSWSPATGIPQNSRTHNQPHRDVRLETVRGVLVDRAKNMEDVDIDWATQLTIYNWGLGGVPGELCIGSIDQLCGMGGSEESGLLRVAHHRHLIGREFQLNVLGLCKEILERSRSRDTIFDTASLVSCQALDAECSETPFMQQMYGRG